MTALELPDACAHAILLAAQAGQPDADEIIGKFGGADQLRTAVNQLQLLLYAAWNNKQH